MNTRKENPRINQQDRQKITFPGSANPKEISQQCTPATHTEAVHCQGVLLGVFHPYLWPLKAPGSTSGGRGSSLSSALFVKGSAWPHHLMTELYRSLCGVLCHSASFPLITSCFPQSLEDISSGVAIHSVFNIHVVPAQWRYHFRHFNSCILLNC